MGCDTHLFNCRLSSCGMAAHDVFSLWRLLLVMFSGCNLPLWVALLVFPLCVHLPEWDFVFIRSCCSILNLLPLKRSCFLHLLSQEVTSGSQPLLFLSLLRPDYYHFCIRKCNKTILDTAGIQDWGIKETLIWIQDIRLTLHDLWLVVLWKLTPPVLLCKGFTAVVEDDGWNHHVCFRGKFKRSEYCLWNTQN